MKDQRLRVFRTAVAGLVESLDAVVRLSRWVEGEAKPEPLVTAAAKLHERLGAADRLAASRFTGPPHDVVKATALCSMMKRLDTAFLAYNKQTAAAERNDAAVALETELSAASALVSSAE